MPKQRDVMRWIWQRCGSDEERAVREYAAAEKAGDVYYDLPIRPDSGDHF